MKFFCRITVALIMLSLPLSEAARAQSADKVSVAFSDPSRSGTLKVSLMSGGLKIKGYNGKEVVVEAHPRGREDSRSEARSGGMRRIVNSSSGLMVEEENNVMSVGTGFMNHTVDLTIQVPLRTSLKLKCLNDGDINVEQVEGEIEANNTNGSVTLAGVSGSAVVHALNGTVKVNLLKVEPNKAMSFSSLNGNIDVTLPADIRASVNMRTDMGEIYSDFEIKLQESPKPVVEDARPRGGRYRVRIDKGISGTINGGGPEIQFKNFNGNIYIRKAGAR